MAQCYLSSPLLPVVGRISSVESGGEETQSRAPRFLPIMARLFLHRPSATPERTVGSGAAYSQESEGVSTAARSTAGRRKLGRFDPVDVCGWDHV